MKKAFLLAVLTNVIVLGLLGCNESEPLIGDHVRYVSYYVANASTQTVIVELSGPINTFGLGAIEVESGDKRPIIENHDYLWPYPDTSVDWWCIKIRRAGDGAVLRHLCPVTNNLWQRADPGEYSTLFTLVITESDLVPTTDRCRSLEGTVVSLSSGLPLPNAFVTLDVGGCAACRTDFQGAYQIWLPCGPQEGRVIVDAEGYVSQEISFPGAVVDLGEGRYSLDVEMESSR